MGINVRCPGEMGSEESMGAEQRTAFAVLATCLVRWKIIERGPVSVPGTPEQVE
jgi:hypothetical protein